LSAAWFEEAVAEPQVVLQDLISAFWGTNVTHTFFRNVAQASPTSSAQKALNSISCEVGSATAVAPLHIVQRTRSSELLVAARRFQFVSRRRRFGDDTGKS
jgi:hypothetical protein